jgi:hypothetical protein
LASGTAGFLKGVPIINMLWTIFANHEFSLWHVVYASFGKQELRSIKLDQIGGSAMRSEVGGPTRAREHPFCREINRTGEEGRERIEH